jgi:hypothetical protein
MSRADSPLHGRMIFNVGARRSGTFWLQRIVTAHPEVAAVPSETHLFSDGIAPLFERFQHSERASPRVGEVYVERDSILDAARDLCDVVFAEFREPGASRVAERTPLHALHLDLIAAIYPDARFVHIIRDGRDVAHSIAAQPWGPETIEGAAQEWRTAVVAARGASLPPQTYREIRYEDLLADAERAIRDVYGWLGLDADDRIVAAAVNEANVGANLGASLSGIAAGKWRDMYSSRELAAFDRVAGDLLAELGYPPSGPEGTARARAGSGRLAKVAAQRLAGIRRRRTPS